MSFDRPSEEDSKKIRKIHDERFEHLYEEKCFHISKRNSQSFITGYQPDCTGRFHFRIRLVDHRYGDALTLTLFQFIRLMKDLRDILCTDEEVEILDDVDARIQFKFKEINVPIVMIIVDASEPVPNLFQLMLRNNKSDQPKKITFNRKTLYKLVQLEEELINTIEVLEHKSCNYMFDLFVKKCADHWLVVKSEKDCPQMYDVVKEMNKTPYQSEVFLKFWPLIGSLINNKIRESLV